jgi:hypothetical protein
MMPNVVSDELQAASHQPQPESLSTAACLLNPLVRRRLLALADTLMK